MQHTILGAIAGDVIGAPFEWNNRKSTDFRLFGPKSRFTDDTVLTVAVAEWLLDGGELTPLLKAYARRYPRAGYGGRFRDWARSENPQPYNSFGNGSAMRVSPVGFAARTLDDALDLAEQSAAVSHDHPEGIRGAQAIAAAIWMARDGASKEDMRGALSERFGYELDFTVEERRPEYSFDVTCQGSVPEALVAFFDSDDYESAIRLAISLGGDSDTIACMCGGVAVAYYGEMPQEIVEGVRMRLPGEFLEVIERFVARDGVG
jgi:ADP-ribosyl-[dinitrogen reductase] hydrolase